MDFVTHGWFQQKCKCLLTHNGQWKWVILNYLTENHHIHFVQNASEARPHTHIRSHVKCQKFAYMRKINVHDLENVWHWAFHFWRDFVSLNCVECEFCTILKIDVILNNEHPYIWTKVALPNWCLLHSHQGIQSKRKSDNVAASGNWLQTARIICGIINFGARQLKRNYFQIYVHR